MDINIDSVITKKADKDLFLREIDKLTSNHGMNTIDAVIFYCERNNIEIETAASLIKNNIKIKSKITVDAENLNFLPKTQRLPFE